MLKSSCYIKHNLTKEIKNVTLNSKVQIIYNTELKIYFYFVWFV